MVGGASLGILFYTVGYVLFVAGKLMQMHHSRSYRDPRNVRRYGFLYERFEPGYIWMSTFVLVRRLAFVAVVVFMESPAFQVYCILRIERWRTFYSLVYAHMTQTALHGFVFKPLFGTCILQYKRKCYIDTFTLLL